MAQLNSGNQKNYSRDNMRFSFEQGDEEEDAHDQGRGERAGSCQNRLARTDQKDSHGHTANTQQSEPAHPVLQRADLRWFGVGTHAHAEYNRHQSRKHCAEHGQDGENQLHGFSNGKSG
jgi:hypothetical protein